MIRSCQIVSYEFWKVQKIISKIVSNRIEFEISNDIVAICLKVRLSRNEYMKSSIFQNTNRKINDVIYSFRLNTIISKDMFEIVFNQILELIVFRAWGMHRNLDLRVQSVLKKTALDLKICGFQ